MTGVQTCALPILSLNHIHYQPILSILSASQGGTMIALSPRWSCYSRNNALVTPKNNYFIVTSIYLIYFPMYRVGNPIIHYLYYITKYLWCHNIPKLVCIILKTYSLRCDTILCAWKNSLWTPDSIWSTMSSAHSTSNYDSAGKGIYLKAWILLPLGTWCHYLESLLT